VKVKSQNQNNTKKAEESIIKFVNGVRVDLNPGESGDVTRFSLFLFRGKFFIYFAIAPSQSTVFPKMTPTAKPAYRRHGFLAGGYKRLLLLLGAGTFPLSAR
jgi:hypothetical protein